MTERPAEVPDAEPSIDIEVTPRDYRLRGLLSVVGRAPPDGRTGLGQARRQVTRDVLRIDGSGIRSGDGLYDQTWTGVVMVWVGSPTGLRTPFVQQPVLSVFTRAGVEFAGRAGTTPSARYSVPVASRWWRGARLCAALRTITSATVVDGRERSRSSAARSLQQPGRPGGR